MKTVKSILPLALAIAPMLAQSAAGQAADKDAPGAAHAPAKLTRDEREMQRFSDAGNSAMRDVRDARFALFEGDTKAAMTLMQSAKASLAQAKKEAPAFEREHNGRPAGGISGTPANGVAAERVPFDGQLVLADNYVMTPEKQAHINKANEHLKKGEHEKALEELRLAEVDVDYTQLMVPIAQTEKELDRAIALSGDGKFYEANLALKSIQDSVTAESVGVEELPKRAAR